MARTRPNRRILVTTINTAVATAAVTATAVGWVAFGMANTNNASAAQQGALSSQQAPAAQQAPPVEDLPVPLRRHHRNFFDGIFGQGQPQASNGHSSQSSRPPLRQPVTRSRSSR